MKYIDKTSIMNKKLEEDFALELSTGDLFISFHTNTDCLGMFYQAQDISKFKIDIEKVILYFNIRDFNELEIKVICSNKVFGIVFEVFKKNSIKNYKFVERDEVTQLLFLTSQGKVRISKEESNVKELRTKKKVLIVDDSKSIRNILSKIISSDPEFEVCAMAERPSEVEKLIEEHRPDILTLDIHMPEMDGVTLLKKIFPKYKIPTVMISSISMAEGPLVLEALGCGAFDYIQKPEFSEIEKVTPMILEKLKLASLVKSQVGNSKKGSARNFINTCNLDSLILLGASTGGTEAIKEILTSLPNDIPPMLIVQHIPPVFSEAFAKRMNDLCKFEVKEATNMDEVLPNRVLIAPGGKQMKIISKNSKLYVEINDDAPVNRFKPSVDYMFESALNFLHSNTIGILLTGMGKDGARGMKKLKDKGVRTIAQNQESCVVFGMPKEAIALGGAEFVEHLDSIASKIVQLTNERKNKRASNG